MRGHYNLGIQGRLTTHHSGRDSFPPHSIERTYFASGTYSISTANTQRPPNRIHPVRRYIVIDTLNLLPRRITKVPQ